MIFTDATGTATSTTTATGTSAMVEQSKTIAKAMIASASKVLVDPKATPAQKQAAAQMLKDAAKIIANVTGTATSTGTSTTTAVPAPPPPPNAALPLPIVPPTALNFFEEHATAIKIGGGIALAGLVGYAVLRRRSRR